MAMSKKRIKARENPSTSKAWERSGHASEESYKEYHKKYYEKNRERILTRKKKDKLADILRHSKKRAKKIGVDHSIDREYLESILTDTCPIFNVKFISNGNLNDWSMTLDRINPQKGYVKGNVQFLSHKANRMKSNASIEELKTFAEYIQKEYP
jgi:hypothetical protein